MEHPQPRRIDEKENRSKVLLCGLNPHSREEELTQTELQKTPTTGAKQQDQKSPICLRIDASFCRFVKFLAKSILNKFQGVPTFCYAKK